MTPPVPNFRGAHASRVSATPKAFASRRLSLPAQLAVCSDVNKKACFDETPKPSRRGDRFCR